MQFRAEVSAHPGWHHRVGLSGSHRYICRPRAQFPHWGVSTSSLAPRGYLCRFHIEVLVAREASHVVRAPWCQHTQSGTTHIFVLIPHRGTCRPCKQLPHWGVSRFCLAPHGNFMIPRRGTCWPCMQFLHRGVSTSVWHCRRIFLTRHQEPPPD